MNWKSLVNRAVKIGVREGFKYLKESQGKNRESTRRDSGSPRSPSAAKPRPGAHGSQQHDSSRPVRGGSGGRDSGYPGDFRGTVQAGYAPNLDGDADPGEVVWGWIPFEEDYSQGKDRPSLVVGRDGQWVLALMLTSKDHIPGGVGEVRADRHARWMNIGTGDWDSQGRPSELRLDRIIRLDPDSIRREGAVMDRKIFAQVAAELGG